MEQKFTSFFDEKPQQHLFTPVPPNFVPELDKALFQGSVTKIKKGNKSQQQIYLVVTDCYIFKGNNRKVYKQLKLLCVKIQTENDRIILSKNKKYIEIVSPNAQSLVQSLKARCVLTNFHSEYIVNKMIGKGTFAKVYLATQKANNESYAIKAFNKEFMLTQHKGKQSIINEMKVMQALHQKNTIKLHEVYESSNSVYFVLDVIEGGELLKRIKEKGIFSQENVKNLMFNLLLALDHLHSQQIIHRDIKPENLLLKTKENDSEIVLADFGLATYLAQEKILFKRCGTPGFVAPEILNFKEGDKFYDEKCDIFSAGVIFFLLLTGLHPFQGSDYKQILQANKIGEIKFNIPELEFAQDNTLNLLKQMLEIHPKKRISAASALKHAYFVQNALESSGQKFIQENLQNYELNFIQGLRINNKQSQNFDSQGSMELLQRNSGINGRTDTVDSIKSNSSFAKLETMKSVNYGVSKFAKKQNSEEYTEPKDNQEQKDNQEPQVKKHQSKQNLHKKAIQNNIKYMSKQVEADPEDLCVNEENMGVMKNLENIHTRIVKGSLQK